jgi:hypothetical protein
LELKARRITLESSENLGNTLNGESALIFNGKVSVMNGNFSADNGYIKNLSTSNITGGNIKVTASSFSVTGAKNRIVDTKNYSNRLLYCYEMSSPMFGDIGDGETDENGKCVVVLDDVFRETIIQPANYQVFLQKCGKGDLWVSEKTESYFVVEGTEKLRFSWEIKAKQRNYESNRLEMEEGEVVTWTEIDYEQEGYKVLYEYIANIEQGDVKE